MRVVGRKEKQTQGRGRWRDATRGGRGRTRPAGRMIHCPIKAGACDYRERLDDHSSSPPSRPLEGMLWGSSQKAVNRLLRPTYYGVRPVLELDHVN